MREPRWRRWLRRGVLLALVSTCVAFTGIYLARPSTDPPVEYRSEPVSRGAIVEVVGASGQLAPRTRVDVGSQTSGNVSRVLVDFGSRVRRNDVLAELDRSTYEVSLRQARIGLTVAKAAHEQASRHSAQLDSLQGEGLVSKDECDRARADLAQAKGAVDLARAQVARARIDLERCQIRSPIDGEVVARNVSVGQTVAASLSAPVLFVIADDLERMQIQASVAEADVGRVEAGQEVEFAVDAFPDETFKGRVAEIRSAPPPEQSVVTYPTIILVDDANRRLRSGMTATVSIVVARRDGVLRLPDVALRFRPPGAARETKEEELVYLAPASPGTPPEPVRVVTGLDDGRYTEILDGPEEGARVATGVAPPARDAGAGGILDQLTAWLNGGERKGKHGRSPGAALPAAGRAP